MAMLAGLSLAIVLLAETAGAAPPAATAAPAEAPAQPPGRCQSTRPGPDTSEIIVCAERSQGYRIDPDVLQASRGIRNHRRPKPPERMKDTSCASVGQMGCALNPGIDILGAAMVAGAMAAKAMRGENVGAMFVTDPQPSEYQLFVEAKRAREAKEAEAAAAAAKATASTASAPQP